MRACAFLEAMLGCMVPRSVQVAGVRGPPVVVYSDAFYDPLVGSKASGEARPPRVGWVVFPELGVLLHVDGKHPAKVPGFPFVHHLLSERPFIIYLVFFKCISRFLKLLLQMEHFS